MIIDVTGTKSRKLHDYIENVALYLGLDKFDTWFELAVVKDCDRGAGGYCHGDDNDIEIEIARNDRCGKIPMEDLMVNIAHEMIHAQQIAEGRLVNDGFCLRGEGDEQSLAYAHTWEGEKFYNLPYSDQPWELEAYSREREVYEACR